MYLHQYKREEDCGDECEERYAWEPVVEGGVFWHLQDIIEDFWILQPGVLSTFSGIFFAKKRDNCILQWISDTNPP